MCPCQGRVGGNNSNTLVKQEEFVLRGQCLPIKQELDESASSFLFNQENPAVNELSGPIKQGLERNASSILVKQENLDV